MLSSSPLALLLLADGRFPAGGHAHSAGAEAAVVDRRVTDVNSLAAFVAGRVRSVGLTDAALAAAAARRVAESSGELPRVLRALDAVAADALAAADGPLADLPARAGPACELAAVEHATRELRMFVS